MHRRFAEVRFVGHVAGNGRVMPEDRILRDGTTCLHCPEKIPQVWTQIVPIVRLEYR